MTERRARVKEGNGPASSASSRSRALTDDLERAGPEVKAVAGGHDLRKAVARRAEGAEGVAGRGSPPGHDAN